MRSKINSDPGFAPNSALINENKPIWGKEFTISLTNGSQSQTVTATNAIIPIQYKATPICNGATSINASNLPTGVTATLNNNVIDISGIPTAQSSGTYNYSLTVSGTTRSSIVTGTISVLASSTFSNFYNLFNKHNWNSRSSISNSIAICCNSECHLSICYK